jgi:NTE family protein
MFKPYHIFCAIALLCASTYAEEQGQTQAVTLYMGGNYSFVEYHLGVLSEIERLQIPIDTVVGTEWGAFTGALWSAGLSSGQIRELVKSWDSLPHAKQPQNSALWKKIWLVKHDENGVLSLEEVDSKPYFGHLFFDFRIQEILLRSNIGSKIHFREIDNSDNYPFPPFESDSATIRIFSNPVALRDTNGTPAQRHQIALWNGDTTLIMLRSHSKPNMDSLFEIGVAVVQSQRSVLAQINPQSRQGEHAALQQPMPQQPRFYHPVFDSTPAELHGHLKSFWNQNDTGIIAVRNFLENLQRDASYRDLKLTADSVFLQIKTDNNPQLSLSLFGFGGTLFGTNIAANTDFRFVNQFGYDLDLTAFYGQGVRGFEGELRLERFFLGDGAFFTKSKILEREPLPFFQRGIDEEARLLSENSRSIILGFEKPTGDRAALQIAAEFERRKIVSGAAKYPRIAYDDEGEEIIIDFLYMPIVVNSMFPYIKWLWQSEGYNRWFASDGFMAEFLGGFKAVSIIDFNQNTAPYASSQGKFGITQPILKYVSISGGAEFGANFRTSKGKLALPEKLEGFNYYDPALDNRYKFAMGMGSYMEEWQTPVNSSHRYGIVSAGLSLQWQGSGMFLTGGYGTEKFFAEPKIRIKSQTFDVVLGQSIVHSAKKRIFLSVQSHFPMQ